MRIAFISAGLGDQEKNIQHRHVPQSVVTDFFYFSDENMPPRVKSMTPRLQAKLPKMLGWMLVPGYDLYVWADSTINLADRDAIRWLISELGDADCAFFRHPERNTIAEEWGYIADFLSAGPETFGREYIVNRYDGEPIKEQVQSYLGDKEFSDTALLSGGLFIYRNNQKTRDMLRDWLIHNNLWSVEDQISLPYVIAKSACKVNVINRLIWDNDYTTFNWRSNSNAHKWDGLYAYLPKEPSAFLYGDTVTYRMGAEFLSDCETVEDWGTGAGGFKRFRQAIGVDGSNTPHADIVADLTEYRSNVDGIFIRHVLEHNLGWKDILENALSSASKKIVVVLFINPSGFNTAEIKEGTAENKAVGVDVPNLRLGRRELFNILHQHNLTITERTLASGTVYGGETMLLIEKTHVPEPEPVNA